MAELVLAKADRRWVFRYRRGEEPLVLRCMAQTAADGVTGFDWADAAVLARQMGLRFSASIKELP